MLNRMSLINFFLTSIATGSSIDASSTTGTFEISDTSVSGYTLPSGPCLFFVVVDVSDTARRETFRITNRTGSILTYDKRISGVTGGGMFTHTSGDTVQINDVAEIMNYLSSNTDDFGLVEGTTGLGIQVKGGRINTQGAIATIASNTFTLTASTTNYVVFDFTDSTFKVLLTLSGFIGVLLATCVTGVGSITSTTDNRAYNPTVAFDSTFFEFTGGELTLKGTGVTYDGFVNLVDTPNSYTGEALKVVRVNAGETALEFAAPEGGTWAVIKSNATQSVPDITQTQFTNLATTSSSDAGMLVTANAIKILTAGTYVITAKSNTTSIPVIGHIYSPRIVKNGSDLVITSTASNSYNAPYVFIHTIQTLAVNDLITFDMYHVSGSSRTFEGTSGGTALTVHKIS